MGPGFFQHIGPASLVWAKSAGQAAFVCVCMCVHQEINPHGIIIGFRG